MTISEVMEEDPNSLLARTTVSSLLGADLEQPSTPFNFCSRTSTRANSSRPECGEVVEEGILSFKLQ